LTRRENHREKIPVGLPSTDLGSGIYVTAQQNDSTRKYAFSLKIGSF
jgi:hypothetical protein